MLGPLSNSLKFLLIGTLALTAAALSIPRAHAQAIIATVNGDPITDIDLAQRMRLLQAFHRPATREAAMDSLIDDQLKLDETSKFKVKAGDAEISQQITREALQMKINPAALLAAMQRAGVSENHIKDHFAADFQFDLLIQAYNKGIDPSESAIREELAKDGGKSAAGINYTLHQIIFISRLSDNPEAAEGRFRAAEQLRTRFTDCASGLPLARDMEDVAVKEEVIRNSTQISDELKDLLDKTPVGHLTPPERSGEGVMMIAVCSKGVSNDDTAIRKAIADKLLSEKFRADAERRLKELRSYAIIVKR